MSVTLKIETMPPTGPLGVNCYIIHNDKHAVVIDPSDNFRAMSRIFDRNGVDFQTNRYV